MFVDESSSKSKSTRRVTQMHTCNYEHCMRPTTHKTEDCLFAKLAAKLGQIPDEALSDAPSIVLGK